MSALCKLLQECSPSVVLCIHLSLLPASIFPVHLMFNLSVLVTFWGGCHVKISVTYGDMYVFVLFFSVCLCEIKPFIFRYLAKCFPISYRQGFGPLPSKQWVLKCNQTGNRQAFALIQRYKILSDFMSLFLTKSMNNSLSCVVGSFYSEETVKLSNLLSLSFSYLRVQHCEQVNFVSSFRGQIRLH